MKLISHNFGIKIVCFLLAGLLWMYTAYDQARVDSFPGSLRLEFRNVAQGLVAIADQENVSIKLVAERNVWNKLSSDSFRAYLDLNGLDEGIHELDVQVQSNVSGVQIVEKNPSRVLVRLDKTTTKIVSIKIKIEGDAGTGLVAGIASVSPTETEISSAQSIVNSVLEATAVVGLNGETESFSKMVKLAVFDSQGNEIKNINFNPEEVKAYVPIVKAAISKTVGIKIKTTGTPKSGYWLSSVSTKPATVAVTGPVSDLGKLNYLETSEVSLDGRDSAINQSVSLNPPPGISILDDVSKVEVTINITPADSSREIQSTPTPINLASNLKIDSWNPAIVKVLLTGPGDGLVKLTSADIVLNINFSGKNAGTYNIDLTKDMFSVPLGFQISGIVPSSIGVVVAGK